LSDRDRAFDDSAKAKTPEQVVFWLVRDSQCAECGEVLGKGRFLFLEARKPLCLGCADLDHLVFLPRGDAALTRRAKKASTLSAVVVRFSRARKRYERQGVLVEEAALEAAEQQCLRDWPARARRREYEAAHREDQDRTLVAQMTEAIQELFPACPSLEAQAIARHTAQRGSGRVGRTQAGRSLDPGALTAAVIAAVRHGHTNYDELLMKGYERSEARGEVHDAVDHVLRQWRLPSRQT
jgi:hypothetical protein